MADNVQWIKLKVGVFDDYQFKKIKRMEFNGKSIRDMLTAVWFELLDLASKSINNGYILNNIEDIALMLDRDESDIKTCIDFYIKNKMLCADEKGLYIANYGYKKNCKYILDCGDKRTSQIYKNWRLCVLDRDKYTCQCCGQKQYLQVHHIIRWADSPENRFNIDNGITLCKKCHKNIHSGGSYVK